MVLFSLGTRLSFIFMALMVFIMVVVLSVFTGFQKEVHNSLWNSGYHITLSRSLAGASLENYSEILEATAKEPALEPLLRSSFPSISINGLLEIQNRFEGKGIRALPVRKEDLKTGDLKDFPRIVHYIHEEISYDLYQKKSHNFVTAISQNLDTECQRS